MAQAGRITALSLLDAVTLWLHAKATEGCTGDTLSGYRRTSRALLAWTGPELALGELTVHQLRAWVEAQQQRGLSPHTVAHLVRGLRAFLGWCVREGLVDDDLHDRIRVPRTPDEPKQGISAEEVARLLETIPPSGARALRDRAIVLLLWDSAIRASELCGLQVEDCRLEGSHPSVSVLGKGRRVRRVGIHPRTANAIRRYLQATGDRRSGPLFIDSAFGALDRERLRLLLRRLCRRAGIRPHGPHAFRHGAAAELLAGGMDGLLLQRQLGHSTPAMVNRYLGSLRQEAVIEAHTRASPVGRLGVA